MLNPLAVDPRQSRLWREPERQPTWDELAWMEQERVRHLAQLEARRWRMIRWLLPTASAIALRLVWMHHPRHV